MGKTNNKNKEYSITINLLIFLSLISIVGITRIIVIGFTSENNFQDISLIDEIQYDANIDMKETILNVKNSLEEYYDVEIYYGDILENIAPQVNATVINDDKKILSMLKDINHEMGKYPDGLIKEIEDKGYIISIYLVNNFTNGNVALSNRTSNGYFNIFLSYTDDMEKSIHHEFYHILDYYIKLQRDENLLYYDWENYNPKGFNYTNNLKALTNEYVYALDATNDISFVSLYSKYSEVEDRAEIFSEMMLSNEDYNISSRYKNVINKMNCITRVLDNSFISVKQNEYWERYR